MRSPRPRPGRKCLLVFALTSAVLFGTGLSIADDATTLPLKTARTITFDTDEGTWISLDVSPDGQTIVFDLLGDLYILPIAGGTATRVTAGMAIDSQPRFSPDGQTIVFTSDRNGYDNLWFVSPDGKNLRQFTHTRDRRYTSPVWAPDGRSIVVCSGVTGTAWANRYPNYPLWLFPLNGDTPYNLTAELGYRSYMVRGPAFHPDGSLYYTVHQGSRVGPEELSVDWVLSRLNLPGKELTEQGSDWGGYMRPVFSPDAHWLIYGTRYASKTGLKVRDMRSGAEHWLLYPYYRDQAEAAMDRDLLPGSAFLPDSSALIISVDGRIYRVAVPSGGKTLIPFTAKVEQQLGPLVRFSQRVDDSRTFTARVIRNTRISPDGRRAAFNALGHVWIKNLPAGEPQRVTDFDILEDDPAWSPDGHTLVFKTWTELGGGHVFTVETQPKVGHPRQLTVEAAYYAHPVFSPDGRRLVVVRQPWRQRNQQLLWKHPYVKAALYWLPADGGEAKMISAVGLPFPEPQFITGSERVYFYDYHLVPDSGIYLGDGSQAGALVSVKFDGSDRRVHLHVTERASYDDLSNSYQDPQKTQGLDRDQAPVHDVRISPNGHNALVRSEPGILYVLDLAGWDGKETFAAIAEKNPYAWHYRRLSDVPATSNPSWNANGTAVVAATGRTIFRYSVDSPVGVNTFPVTIEVPRALPDKVIVLQGARLITMRGDEIIERGDIVVQNDRIQAVGVTGAISIPNGAMVLDVSGTTIMPGIVDIHDHSESSYTLSLLPDWAALSELAFGITTSHEPYTDIDQDRHSLADLIEAGQTLGPRLFSAAPFDRSLDPLSSEEVRAIAGAWQKYMPHVKTAKEFWLGQRVVRQWEAIADREAGLTPTCESAGDAMETLSVVLDGYSGLEHTFPLVPVYKDIAQLFGRAGVVYTPTLTVMRGEGAPSLQQYFWTDQTVDLMQDSKLQRFVPHSILQGETRRRNFWFHWDEFAFPEYAQSAAKMIQAGVSVTVGGHGEFPGLGTHWELWGLATGMSNHQALRAATLYPALGAHVAEDLGSLEPGKLADLIVLKRNPLDNIRNTTAIRYVMKGGFMYVADTLEEIWPEKKLAPLNWWNEFSRDPDPIPNLVPRP